MNESHGLEIKNNILQLIAMDIKREYHLKHKILYVYSHNSIE